MRIAKHTPGPWRVGVAVGTVVSGNGKIASAHCYGSVPDANQMANARLIASAPDMLEALRVTEELLTMAVDTHIYGDDDVPEPDCIYHAGLAMIRAVIFEATGEQS